MKKVDLRTGMIVTLRNERELTVFMCSQDLYNGKCIDVLVNKNTLTWIDLEDFTDDLKGIGFYEGGYDVIKVELPYHPYCLQDINHQREKRKLLWEREEIKEVTMAEVEEKFGCKVKIVS